MPATPPQGAVGNPAAPGKPGTVIALIQRFNDIEAMPLLADKQQAFSDIMSSLNVLNGQPPDVLAFFTRVAQRYGWVPVMKTAP